MSANNFVASGTINPARFVTVANSAAQTVTQGNTGDKSIGICTPSQKLAPTAANSGSTQAASDGDPITVFGLGDICLLTAGSGGFTAGDFLKPDSTGRGVTGGSSDYVSAVAFETTAINQLGRVQIVGPFKI